jgi:hypothetical protein
MRVHEEIHDLIRRSRMPAPQQEGNSGLAMSE